MTVVYILGGLLMFLLAAEAWLNHHARERIPVRIHVNGTRGKSSVTRYITAALQASGLKAMGKVTGETPMIIEQEGKEKKLIRIAPPRVGEQFRVIRKAARKKAEALILECMSIEPLLQQTESTYFRPGICVIPNIRDDHREKMGQNREDQVAAICSAIPPHSVVLSNDEPNLEAIRQAADKKKSKLVIPVPLDPGKMGVLPQGVFVSNIELAVEAAVLAGAERESALQGIIRGLKEDASVIISLGQKNERKFFLNGFKVNDPDSATKFLDYWKDRYSVKGKIAVLFHTRADRPLRTVSFAAWIQGHTEQISCVLITGDHGPFALRKLKHTKSFTVIKRINPSRVLQETSALFNLCPDLEMIVGIGNYKGEGEKMTSLFRNAE